jgi:hypothetical protein
MVGRIAHLSPPPLVPFRSFLPANLLRACPSARRTSLPLRQSNFSPLCFHTPLPRSARGTNPFCHLLAHIDFYFHYFHVLTNPFSRNPFLFTSIQNPRGCGVESPETVPLFLCALSASVENPFFSHSCKLFVVAKKVNSFGIKQIHTLLQKHPGVAYSQKPPRLSQYAWCLRGKSIPFKHLPPLCPLSPPLVLCFQPFAASFPKTPGVGGGPRLHRSTLHRRLTRP